MQKMNETQKVIIAVIALLAIIACYSAEARTPSPQIATLDLASLMVMHPAMAAYDPNMAAFKVTRPRQQFVQDKARITAEKARRIEAFRARIKALESQISAERQRQIREEAQYKTEFDKAMSKLATEAVRLHREVYQNKEAENRQKNLVRLRSIKLQIDQLNRQIENENAEMLSDRFTTPAETRQRIAQILAEVRQHAQVVAAGKNITIVLDSGGASFQQMASSGSGTTAGAIDYSEVFAKPLLSPITLASDEASVQGYYNLRRDKAIVWYNHRAMILAPYRNELANTAVLVGGVDITLEVLNSILKNYRVEQAVYSILNSVIQSGGR
jgi:hypothetical protein